MKAKSPDRIPVPSVAELENSDVEEDDEKKQQQQQQQNEVEVSPESPLNSSQQSPQPDKLPESLKPDKSSQSPQPPPSPKDNSQLNQEPQNNSGNDDTVVEEQSTKSPLESPANNGVEDGDVDVNNEEQLTDSLAVDE